ncbi:hypothetical protein NDU88_002635 [Pleurodeles waltl]|uniref:Uncharacterized protein n=1 Tax=Pleurodeles waltl TaxID=8319 RepID=A0AAV7UAF8_PLEWA|nr:hypothetical protein NDU88_002635 [Pleurodeles waltl]
MDEASTVLQAAPAAQIKSRTRSDFAVLTETEELCTDQHVADRSQEQIRAPRIQLAESNTHENRDTQGQNTTTPSRCTVLTTRRPVIKLQSPQKHIAKYALDFKLMRNKPKTDINMVKPKPQRAQLEARPIVPSLEIDTEHHSKALHTVTETLAAHSTQMEKVLQAILDTRTSLEGKTDTVVAEVNIFRMEHRKLANRVTTTETTLNTAQRDIADMKL